MCVCSGALTIPLARAVPQGLVVALEPQRVVAQMLGANVHLNALANVDVRRALLGRLAKKKCARLAGCERCGCVFPFELGRPTSTLGRSGVVLERPGFIFKAEIAGFSMPLTPVKFTACCKSTSSLFAVARRALP